MSVIHKFGQEIAHIFAKKIDKEMTKLTEDSVSELKSLNKRDEHLFGKHEIDDKELTLTLKKKLIGIISNHDVSFYS